MIIHKSTILVGTTEGRFRMIMPTLMRQFKEMYNDYDIRGIIGNAEQLREMLENGELDIAFSGISPLAPECIEKEFLFDERLYLVVSEQMLQKYFPDRYPECVEEFRKVQIFVSLARCLFAGVCLICIVCRYQTIYLTRKELRQIVCTHQVIQTCISRWRRRIWRCVSACPCICHICTN